ncbi:MAG: uroporphyrinogen decarboxylase family protein [Desulfomonilaceae bacterium]
METGRELFNKFLKREPMFRPPFVPLVRGLTARIEGMPYEALTSDPTLWANSLSRTAELFGFDGVVAGFQLSLMAEACGCRVTWAKDRPMVLPPAEGGLREKPEAWGRMKNVLEAASRVFRTARAERACVAALTGPVTLASQLFGKEEGPKHLGEVKQLIVRVTEAFCQTRPDVLIFMEGKPLGLAEVGITHRRIYSTLKNILSYYNVFSGLYLEGYQHQTVNVFSSLGMDLYVLGPSAQNGFASLSDLWDLGADALGVGLGLPVDDFHRAKEIINEGLEFYRSKGGRGFFFTSLGPVTRDTSLETLHKLVNEIRQVRL